MQPQPERSFSPNESLAVRRRGERFAIVSAATVGGTIACALIVASLMRPEVSATQTTAFRAPDTTSVAERVTPPAAGTTSVADCPEQTSPYVAQPCRVGEASKRRARTEKLAVPVIASQPAVGELAAKTEAQAPYSNPAPAQTSTEPVEQHQPSQGAHTADEDAEVLSKPPTRNIRRAHSSRRGYRSASDVYYRRHTAQF